MRICHLHLLWSDEDYHLAAAINILHGKIPYRDFWYDKPPLCAAYYLLIGGYPGWMLRCLDAGYVVLACWLAYRVARIWWGEREGYCAALLLASFTTFYLPAAVIPFAPDALLIAPQLAAILFASQKRAGWAGFFCGMGLLVNVKAAFVLVVCAIWLSPELPLLLAGAAVPLAGFAAWLWISGAAAGFYEQVWRWGLLYAQGSPVAHPFELGLGRVSAWLGFHCALILGAGFGFAYLRLRERWKLGSWMALSFAAVCLGNHFAPRYFLQLLPALAIVAARGISRAHERWRGPTWAVLALLLAAPFVRFGFRYASLAADDIRRQQPKWTDVAMDLDSQQAALKIRQLALAGDTLFVWGYRPDIYVYTRMTSGGLFWDSQPLTGVPADRHLSSTTTVFGGPAERNREELIRTNPTFVVDGLGPLNPALRPENYAEIRQWLARYEEVGRTKLCVIYRLIPRKRL